MLVRLPIEDDHKLNSGNYIYFQYPESHSIGLLRARAITQPRMEILRRLQEVLMGKDAYIACVKRVLAKRRRK